MTCSGFVDLQVNGFAGVDFNDPTLPVADFSRACDAILPTGVTRFLPTVVTASHEAITACLRNLDAASSRIAHPKMVAGFHIEGPHIGAEDGPRGAHPRQWVRPPSTDEFQRWQEAAQGRIRLVTLSPHWPAANAYIEFAVQSGVAIALGHTSATPRQISDAVSAGATLSTHLGNAAPAMIDRRANLLWTQLAEDRLTASFIVDGFHLDNAFLRTALRAKGEKRSVLVTDASAPAAASPGLYKLGAQDVELLPEGRIVLRGTQKLAGSALRMNEAIFNAIHLGGVNLEDAIAMATTNPARIIGLPDSGDDVEFRLTKTNLVIIAVSLQ